MKPESSTLRVKLRWRAVSGYLESSRGLVYQRFGTMSNDVMFQVDARFMSSTASCDCVNRIGRISDGSEVAMDHYGDSGYSSDSEASDLSLPINNIGRMMKLSIPGSAKISRDSKILMQQISKDFIGCISSQAGEICTSNKRRVLNGEDIINALSSFGFGDYTGTLINYLNIWKGVKQSRGVKPYGGVYKSGSPLFGCDEGYQVSLEGNQRSGQFFQCEKGMGHGYVVDSSNRGDFVPTSQAVYSSFPKRASSALNSSADSFSVKQNGNSYDSLGYLQGLNSHYIASKDEISRMSGLDGAINMLSRSPTKSSGFRKEPSTKPVSWVNQYGKRERRMVQAKPSTLVGPTTHLGQGISACSQYKTSRIKNHAVGVTEFTGNCTFQDSFKSTAASGHDIRGLEPYSNLYKQEDLFFNKSESSFDSFFSDLNTLDESENESEYNAYTYQSGQLFTS